MPPYRTDVTKFKIIDQALVDNEQWYTIQVHPDLRHWMYEQHKSMWYEHIDQGRYRVANTFDVHEKIYTMLAVRWS
jgi:hypothetical protein